MQGVNCSLIPMTEPGFSFPLVVNVLIENEFTSLMVLKRGSDVVAYTNVCPHQGRRLDYAPGQLLLKDESVICPAHGAVFNVADGLCTQGPCKGESLKSYRCELLPEAIQVYW